MFGIDDVAAAMVITAVISSVVSAASTAYNGYQTDKTNAQNKDLYNQSLEANKEVAQNGLSWKVQDAERAGLSPLAALNSSTHGNLVSSTNPTMQAPQADPSALISSLTSMSNEYASDETRKQVEASQAKTARTGFRKDKYIAELNAKLNEEIAQNRLNFDKDKAENELNEQIREYNNTYALDLQKFNTTQRTQYDLLETEITERTAKRLESVADTQSKVLADFAKNNGVYIRQQPFYITDENSFNEWLTLDNDFSDNFASSNKALYDAFQAMTPEERYNYVNSVSSKSKGWNAGLNASGEAGNQNGTNENVSERVTGPVKVGKETKNIVQGKTKGNFNLASMLLKGAGLSGGYNSSESQSDAWQKSSYEDKARNAGYFHGLTYYRPVFTDSFVQKYAGKYTYSDVVDMSEKSKFRGYSREWKSIQRMSK